MELLQSNIKLYDKTSTLIKLRQNVFPRIKILEAYFEYLAFQINT